MIALMQSMRRKVLGHKAKDINARRMEQPNEFI